MKDFEKIYFFINHSNIELKESKIFYFLILMFINNSNNNITSKCNIIY